MAGRQAPAADRGRVSNGTSRPGPGSFPGRMELLLVRHALPVRRELESGAADPELDERGHAQARLLAVYLAAEKPLHAVYVSPMQRARQTAHPVVEHFGIDAVVVDGIAENDRNSPWYVPVEELKASNDPRWQQIMRGENPEGWNEDPQEFRTRVVTSIEAIIDANPGRKVAAVCHGGVINAYLSHIIGLGDSDGFFYPNYTSIHRVIAARSGERTIQTLNETHHLRGSGLPVGMNHQG